MNDFSFYRRYNLFAGKKILSIDYGTKVIGTACYSPGMDPFPFGLEKIIYKSDEEAIKSLTNLIDNEGIDILVLGVPYFLDGKESENTKKIKSFGEALKRAFPKMPFYEQDETLTTKTAEERMKNSPEYNFKVDVTKIDVLSAIIILEDFIREEI